MGRSVHSLSFWIVFISLNFFEPCLLQSLVFFTKLTILKEKNKFVINFLRVLNFQNPESRVYHYPTKSVTLYFSTKNMKLIGYNKIE